MDSTTFTIKIGTFEGPLDLLLSLIEERKLHISEVSLSSVAEEFIEFVKAQEAFPLGQASHFIVIAATLLLLKSKALLPMLTLTEEEEGDIKDLEERLKLYQLYRTIAKGFEQLLKTPLYSGGIARDTSPIFSPSKDLSQENLVTAMNRVLMQAPKVEKKKEVSVKAVISLEEMMGRLSARIERALSLSFKEFVGNPEDRREIAVGFLAVLELVKQGTLIAEQHGRLTDIKLAYTGAPKAPKYD